ncbi:DUF5675 family protein [Sphingobacterium sp. UGAL515B_05]|uniref:DUF5675 family protein n=1 Tax=Sphingobacterium sp. UGAL515B_05 TaxID=2986767 RepID=UPI0029554057|nr:DUF5675 family protein [Sphingobacterium sp. UGAL515B_05]WON93663.1 DUF5675 family protein [Sphingobacterium sp. UGAL515B_05]
MKSTIKVLRTKQGKHSTLSEIYLNNQFVCYGLENIPRPVKIRGETAIPAGLYPLGFNRDGAMNGRYYDDYPKMHRGMLEIRDIPSFSHVYFHKGNSYKQTAGCILVGSQYVLEDGDYRLLASGIAYKKLYPLATELMAQGLVDVLVE